MEAKESMEGEWSATYFEISAKSGNSVEQMFKTAAESLLDQIIGGTIDQELYQV